MIFFLARFVFVFVVMHDTPAHLRLLRTVGSPNELARRLQLRAAEGSEQLISSPHCKLCKEAASRNQ